VWQSLPAVYQELWQLWDGQGSTAPADETSSTERSEFAALLASQARVGNGSRSTSKSEADRDDQGRRSGGRTAGTSGATKVNSLLKITALLRVKILNSWSLASVVWL
jgi:hypothetical protein